MTTGDSPAPRGPAYGIDGTTLEVIMILRNPGPVQPAPTLPGTAGTLAEAIGGWPGVSAFTHWRLGSPGVVDGSEFHVGDEELGHVHLDGTAHIPFDRPIASLLAAKGLGRTPSWSDAWITCPVRSTADMERAEWLFSLAHARIQGASSAALVDRIATGVRAAELWANSPPA